MINQLVYVDLYGDTHYLGCGKSLRVCTLVVKFMLNLLTALHLSFHREKKKRKKKGASDVLCEQSPISERGMKVIENPQQ